MIVDGHLDLACNALVDGRDSTRSALAIPAEEAGGPIETSNGRCMVGLPELLAGDVRLIVATLFAMPRSEAGKGECGYEAIEAVAEVAGSARHVAIGSDYDGGFGSEKTPDELDTVGDHRKIGEALAARGWSADDVAGVLGGNWLRVLGGLYA